MSDSAADCLGGYSFFANLFRNLRGKLAVGDRRTVRDLPKEFPNLFAKGRAARMQRWCEIGLSSAKIRIQPALDHGVHRHLPFCMCRGESIGIVFLPIKPKSGQTDIVCG